MRSCAGLVEAHKACFPGNSVLRKRLDDWTEDFEAEQARKRREAAAAQEKQGWTVVKRRGVSHATTSYSWRRLPVLTVSEVAATAQAPHSGCKGALDRRAGPERKSQPSEQFQNTCMVKTQERL